MLNGVDIRDVDVRDEPSLHQAFHDVDTVFHLAALGSVPRSLNRPCPTYEVNTLGSINVFEAARCAGARRVVYASSSSVYGNTNATLKVEGEEGDPISPYAASKAAMELAARTHSACYGLDIIGLRFFNVFGPFQRPDAEYAAVVPLFTQSLLEGRSPVIFGDGEQVRDFTFVDDVLQALELAALATGPFAGDAVNVSGGRPVSVNRLFEHVRSAVGASDIASTHTAERQGDIRVSRADLSLAGELLGYEPSWTMADGMKQYVAWLTEGADRSIDGS